MKTLDYEIYLEEHKEVLKYADQVIEDSGVLTVRFSPTKSSENTLELAKCLYEVLEAWRRSQNTVRTFRSANIKS